jgi:hypothetical protein
LRSIARPDNPARTSRRIAAYSSTFAEHCANLPETSDRKIVLADYDPRLGYLSLCRLDTAAA